MSGTSVRRPFSTSVRSLLFAAGAASVALMSPGLMAQTQEAPTAALSIAERLDEAARLLDSGKIVQARAMLVEMTGSTALTDAEKTRALALANNANRKFRALSPVEASLQTAAYASGTGELSLAIAQANAVIESADATNAQVREAREVLTQVQAKQADLAPGIPGKLTEALADIAGGRSALARAKVQDVVRSGVTLSAEDQARLTFAQNELVGAMDHNTAMAGMMQPGVVKRRTNPTPQPAPSEPAPQPAPQPAPATETPAPAPAEQAQPEPAPAPAADILEQVQPVTVAQPQSSGDPIAAARQWQAQSLLAEADFAFSQNRFNEAVQKYSQLLNQFNDQLTPEQTQQARQRMSDAQVRLGNDAAQGNLLENVLQSNRIARQSAEAEYTNDLAQAESALSRGDTQRARDLAAQARVRIGSNRAVFTNEEVEGYSTRVDELMARIDAEDAKLRARSIQEQADIARSTAAEQAAAQAQDKARKLNESIDRVRALQIEQKYEEALQVVQSQILFLDPTNPTGLLLADVLADTIVWRRYNDINRAAARGYGNEDLNNADAAVPPGDIVNYPSDWPAISATRGTPVAFAEAEENRRALATLQTKRIPVKFEETPLEAAIGFIQTVSQLNIDTDWASLEDQGIDRGTTVNLNLTNVTLETVLNRITEKVSPPGDSQGGAGWTITDGVINVASKQVINRQRTLAIYDIRDLIVEVPDYPDAPELDLQQALQASQQGGGGGGQSPFQEEGETDVERRTLAERTQEIIDIITTNVDTDGWRENGGDTGYIQQLAGLLIITNTPANHRSIHGLLSKLREYRALQINVETRFLLVSQDFFEQIGVDLDVYLNANSNVVRQARGTRPTTRASDFFDPVTGRYRDTFPQAGSTGANLTRTPLGDPWSPVSVGQNSLGLSESLIGTDFAQDVFQTAPALGIAGQFLDDIQVDFMIKATQADRRTVSLTAPRLTFTNGQISNIYVITQVSFVSDLEPVTSESAAAFDPTPATVAEGVVMEVDGTVAADRKYVTMNIIAGVTRVDAISQLPVTAIAGGQLVNSAAAQSFIQLPQVTVTRVATTVTVPDQGTILLGGQRLTTEQEVESGVPVLSKIPVLNRLFTNRVMTREENTLLILLKPTILIQSEKEEQNFPGLSESLSLSTR